MHRSHLSNVKSLLARVSFFFACDVDLHLSPARMVLVDSVKVFISYPTCAQLDWYLILFAL